MGGVKCGWSEVWGGVRCGSRWWCGGEWNEMCEDK